MDIQAGITYSTREGGTAQIDSIEEDEHTYQIRGHFNELSGGRRIAFWTASGRYKASGESPFDIVLS